MSVDVRTIGEELVGAEIVAGKELTEAAGSLFDALDRAAAIWLQQGQWLIEDYGRFWLSSLGNPLNAGDLRSLVEARSEHIASGMHQVSELIERECTPMSKMWTDYLGTVVRDWRRA